jgi:hypothetical protein
MKPYKAALLVALVNTVVYTILAVYLRAPVALAWGLCVAAFVWALGWMIGFFANAFLRRPKMPEFNLRLAHFSVSIVFALTLGVFLWANGAFDPGPHYSMHNQTVLAQTGMWLDETQRRAYNLGVGAFEAHLSDPDRIRIDEINIRMGDTVTAGRPDSLFLLYIRFTMADQWRYERVAVFDSHVYERPLNDSAWRAMEDGIDPNEWLVSP